MNKSLSFFALMLALATGSAAAVGTPAGSTISNIATASYNDDNGAAQPNVSSNNGVPVTTTIQAVPSFTILPNSTGTPLTAGFTPGQQQSVKPGQTNVVFTYILTNSGNVPNESYSIGRATFNSGSAGIANIRYYLETGTTAGFDLATDTLITNDKISGLAPDAQRTFYVVYDISSAAVNSQKLGLTPIGTRDPNSTYDGGQTFTLTDGDNYNQSVVTRLDAGNLGPQGDADANGTLDGTATAVTPYDIVLGGTTYNRVTPSGDTQTTLAPASSAAQVVYFTNTVRNSGNRDDSFTLTVPNATALDAAGFPAGSVAELFVDNAGVLTPVTTTTLLAADPDGTGTGLGGSFSFIVRVTLPANAMPDLPGTVPSVTVTATSANDATQSDTTVDRVQIERGLFGNATPGAPGTPAADPTLNPTKPGTPGQPVSIPMDLYNAGNVSGAYTLAGSVTFTDANGQPVIVPITYYADANGDGVADNATAIVTQTVASGAELKVVGVVTVPAGAASATAPITQSATLKNSGGTTVIVYSDNNDTVQVGLVGGVTVKKFVDNTKPLDAATPYPAEPAITVDPATYNAGSQAKPADVLRYVIYGRNTRNTVIKDFILSDTLPVNSALYSILGTYNANGSTYTNLDKRPGSKVVYRVGTTGAWSATAPTDSTLPSGTIFQVAYDWNNDNLIDNTDVLPSGAELKLVFKVTVK